jgi:hypothetical protein
MTLPNPPAVEMFEFDTTQITSPIGNRNIEQGCFAFVQRVALGSSVYSGLGTSGTLIFKDVRFNVIAPVSDVASRVHSLIFRMATSGFQITNMRLFSSNESALRGSVNAGLDPAIIQYAHSGIWQPNPIWPSGITPQLPSVAPSTANLFRQDGGSAIVDLGDADVSEFIYLNLIVPNGFPLGRYGAGGSGLLRLAVLFDYS